MQRDTDMERLSFHDGTDDELLVEAREVGRRNKWKRWGSSFLGAVALIGCVLVAHHALTGAEANGHVSARALLESRELANVVTEQMIAATGHQDVRKESMRDQVHTGFKDMSQHISERCPQTAMQLDQMTLSPEEQAAMFRTYRYMGDPRVQSLGLDILQAASEAQDHASLKQRLLAKVQPRADEIRQLRDQIMPLAKGQAHSVDFDHLRITRDFDEWHMEMAVKGRKLAGLSFPMAQQTQVFLDFISSMKPDFKMPDLASGLQEGIISDFFKCLTTSMQAMELVEAASCASTYFSSAVSYLRTSFGLGGGTTA